MAETGRDGGSAKRGDDRSGEKRGVDAVAKLSAAGRENYDSRTSNSGTQVYRHPGKRERDDRARGAPGGKGKGKGITH